MRVKQISWNQELLADDLFEADQAQLLTVVLGILWKGRRELTKAEQREGSASKFCIFEDFLAGKFGAVNKNIFTKRNY